MKKHLWLGKYKHHPMPQCISVNLAPWYKHQDLLTYLCTSKFTHRYVHKQTLLDHSSQMFPLQNCWLTCSFNIRSSKTTIWINWSQNGKPFWVSIKQGTMEWQWLQMDHIIILHLSPSQHWSFFTDQRLLLGTVPLCHCKGTNQFKAIKTRAVNY